jgi:hypothetical protein
MFGINLRVLRFYYGWMFAMSSLICVILAFWVIHHTFTRHNLDVFFHLKILLLFLILPVGASVFGVAWWAIWKERKFSRFWGIAASFLTMVSPIRHIMLHPRMLLNYSGVVLAFGIIGLIAFSMREKVSTEIDIVGIEDSESEADPS